MNKILLNSAIQEFITSHIHSNIHELVLKGSPFDGIDIKITSSGGVAFSTETETSADLTNKADERLYEAKKSGRNRFKLIDTELVGDQ